MKTLIVYATRHGSTEKVTSRLMELIKGDVTSVNLEKQKVTGLENYDLIIIGGSIHEGSIQSSIHKFCIQHERLLLEKNLGLFILCIETGIKALTQIENAFPEPLRAKSLAMDTLGGEFLIERMNFIEKFLVKKIMKTKESVYRLDNQAIEVFAQTLLSKTTQLAVQ